MDILNGKKTYLGIIIALIPTLIDIVQSGLTAGDSYIVIVGLIIAAVGRAVTKANA